MIWVFFFIKCGVQHETLFDSGGDANDMGVGFRGTVSCMFRHVGAAHPLSELAGRSKVDNLDGRSLGVTKKDVFWFQVTVDD